MTRVVALLAAVIVVGLAACGDDGAEPGASSEATLVLDFTPNAVHAGLYAAAGRGWFAGEGLELEIRAPGESTDAPKLLQAGRAEFAVLDINDWGIARDRGLDLVPVAALVQVPLGSVIAADRDAIRRPRDLEGATVGVTGLPSDDAVLDRVVASDGGDPARVDRTTVGFDSVAALSAGRVDAATAFWNAEGVALRELGVPTREFRVGEATGEPFPELLVVTTRELVESEPELVDALRAGIERGYALADDDPAAALEALLTAEPGLERSVQEAQIEALTEADAFAAGVDPGVADPGRIANWRAFAQP
jgi:NitT/TauT family transport system substrate-binding protein/putative hydroxymethylpyrimidine transport system substrate-binding protein